ncbi:hypothetical protein JCM8547_007072 [Rhodosporidiobolus lusitaniae]
MHFDPLFLDGATKVLSDSVAHGLDVFSSTPDGGFEGIVDEADLHKMIWNEDFRSIWMPGDPPEYLLGIHHLRVQANGSSGKLKLDAITSSISSGGMPHLRSLYLSTESSRSLPHT